MKMNHSFCFDPQSPNFGRCYNCGEIARLVFDAPCDAIPNEYETNRTYVESYSRDNREKLFPDGFRVKAANEVE